MKLIDLVDVKQLQELWQSFSDAFDVPTAILDMEGNVLVATNWQPICTQFHRVNPETAKRCMESDTALANSLKAGENYNVYRCKNGLVDIAVPIIIKGEHIANFYIGQFLFEKPNRSYFKQQARDFGFDTTAYLDALDTVPVVDEVQVGKIMTFLVKQIKLIAEYTLVTKQHEESERRLLESQSIAKIGQWELDLRSDTLYWSNEVFSLFEIDKEKFSATYEAFVNAIHPEDAEAVNSAYINSLKTKQPYEITHRLQMSDGRIKYVRELCRTEFEGDKPLLSIGTIQDITDLKRTEIELVHANKKLKELDRMKSMFIASMSHELRTPLNSIIGFSDILLKGMAGKLEEKQKDYLGRISTAGKHLLSMIVDVIDISKIEAGHIEIVPEQFELKALLDEVADMVEMSRKKKNISLKIELDQTIELYSDKRRVEQCILNYLSNAVKYSENGEITIRAYEEKEHVVVSLSDMGIGFDDENRKKLFQPFERLESHIKVKAGGTGLGLYLTKKIVEELLGGEVFVSSKLGKGSTFGLKIPKAMVKKTGGDEVNYFKSSLK